MKKCNKCGEEKAEDQFYTKRNRKGGVIVWEGLYSHCKYCVDQKNRKWGEDNRDKTREWCRRWRAEHLEYERKRYREYYRDNKDKCREQYLKFIRDNPGYERRKRAERVARQKNATPKWIDWEEVDYIYSLAQEKDQNVDHIVPLTSDKVCGLHVGDNLRVIPFELNVKKGNRYWPDMWDYNA